MSRRRLEDAEVQLHGGHDGFDKRVFAVVDPSDFSAYSLFSDSEKEQIIGLMPAAAIFKLTSPDKDEGYPGQLDLEVLVALVQPGSAPKSKIDGEYQLGSVIIVYRAKVEGEDGKKTVTPVNLTQVRAPRGLFKGGKGGSLMVLARSTGGSTLTPRSLLGPREPRQVS